ncbi:DUF6801 domain-containing protein [Amycolatopsis japonica]|uniref:DUF6801 domain-containing protein n=1 Tax=Amycolatopsis japonica TaxID=208439 RepID=UPI00332A5E44
MRHVLGRLAAAVTAIVVSGVLTAPTASATTDYSTSTLTYSCNLPGVGVQPVYVRMSFHGPDSVPSGGTFTPADFTGSLTFNAAAVALFNAGFDRLRGGLAAPITGSNVLPPPVSTVTMKLPEVPGPFVAPFTAYLFEDPGSAVLTFTAGTPGTAALALGSPLSFALELRSRSGSWMAWQIPCAARITNPPQNNWFGPSILVD